MALIILIGSIKALSSDELVHALVYLALTLGAVAGIYLTLGAEFLAAIQILVYVGAVITLFLFAVMLTTPTKPTEGFAEDRTPLSVLGVEAPRGMDVEAMDEAPEDVETVAEAEARAAEGDDEVEPSEDEVPETDEPSDEEDAEPGTDPEEADTDQPSDGPEPAEGDDEGAAEPEPDETDDTKEAA